MWFESVRELKKLVFIPTYNELENVELLYRRLRAVDKSLDTLFMDDHSPDGTGQVLDKIASRDPSVHVIHRSSKRGIGSAHRDGIQWAYAMGYDTLVTMDCDFTHEPEDIPRFLENGHTSDVVVGSRYLDETSLKDWNLIRKALTNMGHVLTTRMLRMPYDATSAFRVYRLSRIPKGLLDLVGSKGYAFFFESLYVLHMNGLMIKEIPIRLPKRTYGHSKMRLKDIFVSLRTLASIYLKATLNRKALTCVPPILSLGPIPDAGEQQEWDSYWSKKKSALHALYGVFAVIYRMLIIKRSFNHYMRKTFSPEDRILHAGCGGGQVDEDMTRELNVTALDISRPALEHYRRVNTRARVIHGSIFKMPFPDESFDGLYNVGVMEHFMESDITKILNEFKRVLKPGGRALFFWPSVSSPSAKVLDSIHFILNDVLKRGVKLHPAEPTRARSREHLSGLLSRSGFHLTGYHFGGLDLYTQVAVVCEKSDSRKIPSPSGAGVQAVEI